MRIPGVIILLAAVGAAQAQASSIETLAPMASPYPSIEVLGEDVSIDPSIVAAVAETGPTPSIVELADTPATPSVISLGGPAPAGEDVAATPPAASQDVTMPMVIRGGEVGSASASPSPAPAQAATQPGVPLLDPNDRGTPSKRKALKRQAERLAEQEAAGQQNPQPDPSTQPAPLGQ
jgi:hypothetical protein